MQRARQYFVNRAEWCGACCLWTTSCVAQSGTWVAQSGTWRTDVHGPSTDALARLVIPAPQRSAVRPVGGESPLEDPVSMSAALTAPVAF